MGGDMNTTVSKLTTHVQCCEIVCLSKSSKSSARGEATTRDHDFMCDCFRGMSARISVYRDIKKWAVQNRRQPLKCDASCNAWVAMSRGRRRHPCVKVTRGA
eukprot:4870211-Pleurochrysis_carterae.AAC.1